MARHSLRRSALIRTPRFAGILTLSHGSAHARPTMSRPSIGWGSKPIASLISAVVTTRRRLAANTRRMLERVPEEHFDWKPHEKSMSLSLLATHIAQTPEWGVAILEQDELVINIDEYVPHVAKSQAELMGLFDKNVAVAIESLKRQSNERLFANWQYMRTPISLDIAETVVRDLVQGIEPRRIKIEDILRIISRHFGVSKGDLLSQRRHRSVVWPRQIGMYLAKQLTARSLPEIGRRFGNRDHTTVLHAIRKIENEISGNPRLRDEIDELKKLLSH